jgi:dihydropteroate synthase
MGILNVTPDSFFDGGRYTDPPAALERVRQMVSEGADIIDIGAASTRPGAGLMDPGEEIARLDPVLHLVRNEFPDLILSVDTYNAGVAKQVVTHFGADIINDVSAGELDPGMIPLIGKLNVPYIIMHMKGVPGDMQDNPVYQNVTDEVIRFFSAKVHLLHSEGVSDVLLDPGFGFGKTMDHNYELLSQVSAFQMFALPVVAGVSRKSMIYRLLESSSEASLNGTTAVNMLLLQGGVNIIRVHDVKEAKEAVTIFNRTVHNIG